MSIKAVLTTLILGSSSVALAHPATRDHRFDRGFERHEGSRQERREQQRNWREPVRTWREPERTWREPERESREHEWREHEHRWEPRPIYREGFYRAPAYTYEQTPVYYGAPNAFAGGSMFLGLNTGSCRAIELSTSGSTYVTQVAIQYVDGRSVVEQVGGYLDASNPTIELPTDGTPVSGVTVYGNGSPVSAYPI